MSSISGRIATFAFAKQTAKGTGATVPLFKLLARGEPSLRLVKERGRLTVTDSGRDLGPGYTAGMRVEGEIPIYLYPDAFALFAAAALGANADSGTEPNFTHVATAANDGMWMTVWRMVGNVIFEKFIDCKLNRLAISGEAGAPAEGELGFVGITSAFEAAEVAGTPVATPVYLYPELNGRILVGGSARRIHSFAWAVNNNFAPYQADDYLPSDIDPGGREFELSFSTRFTGADDFPGYRTHYYGSSSGTSPSAAVPTQPMSLEFLRDVNTSLKIEHPQVAYEEIPVQPNPDGDPIAIEVPCVVEKPSSGNICTITTKDNRASIV